MAAGDLTVTSNSYNTLALAVAAMDAENLPATSDTLDLIIEPGVGADRFAVIKKVREA